MKVIFVLLLITIPNTLIALGKCPDLTGNYIFVGDLGGDGDVEHRMNQKGCESITYYIGGFEPDTYSLNFDGKFHNTKGWGVVSALTKDKEEYSANFVGKEMQLKIRKKGTSKIVREIHYFLSSNGNLVINEVTGKPHKIELKRIK